MEIYRLYRLSKGLAMSAKGELAICGEQKNQRNLFFIKAVRFVRHEFEFGKPLCAQNLVSSKEREKSNETNFKRKTDAGIDA